MSGSDVGGMAVKTEPSHWCYITVCCAMTDGSKGAVWQMVPDMEVQMKQRYATEFLHAEKWHPLTLINACWMFMETKQ